jgi:hypothetical protein
MGSDQLLTGTRSAEHPTLGATPRKRPNRRSTVRLTFLGKESQPNNSPTLFVTDRDTYVVQGWIVTDPQALDILTPTDDETIVEIPPKLMVNLVNDGVSGDVTNLVPPIVHILENGNYIFQGARVTDTKALAQMNIPSHESCVEVPKVAVTALIGG